MLTQIKRTPPDAERQDAGSEGAGTVAAEGVMPVDVARLMADCDAPIRHYLDAHRLRTIERSQADWPSLWRMAGDPP